MKTLVVAADADGQPFEQWEEVKALRRAQAQLKRANQALSRTKRGSTGRAKARARLAKLHARIARQRPHVVHQVSHDLATLCQVVCVEDLNVAGRWYASSKTCSGCGHLKEHLELSERTCRCDICGLDIDWDLGAAINLARWPARQQEHPQSPPLTEAA